MLSLKIQFPVNKPLRQSRILITGICVVFVLLVISAAATRPTVPMPGFFSIASPDFQRPSSPALGQRPIWFVDAKRNERGELSGGYIAVAPDGARLATFAGGLLSWAPDGASYVFVSSTQWNQLFNIRHLQGKTQVIGVANPRRIFWQPAWSPTGKKIAVVTFQIDEKSKIPTYSLIIVDCDSRFADVEYPLPAGTMASYPAFEEAPDKVRWSPDGRWILISWGDLIVVRSSDGKVQRIAETQAAADWSPSSDSVYYLAAHRAKGDTGREWDGIFARRLDGSAPTLLADPAHLAALGLKKPGFNNGQLLASPDGRLLAVGGGNGYKDNMLLFFDLPEAGANIDFEHPRAVIHDTGVVTSLDWAPDSKSVATVAITNELSDKHAQITVRITPLDGGYPKFLSKFEVRAVPYELDWLAFKTLSWSR